ncbi:MAG: hypothetical protein JW850_04535, partial [Thermoflexales bacterium]|nr:hypothetical protein [Thermoflexales bacterium]
LLGCPRKERLKQLHNYWLKPTELWWAYRGQLMHGIAAQYVEGDPHAFAETRLAAMIPMGDELVEITGQPDLVLLDRGHLVDYKTTKSVPGPWRTWVCPETGELVRERSFAWRNKMISCPHCEAGTHVAREIVVEAAPRPYPRHAQQVSLYALLLAENGVEVQTGEIVYQDMSVQLRVPVALMPPGEAMDLMKDRLRLHLQPNIPDILTDPAELWECDYCPVRRACEMMYGGPVGKAGFNGNGHNDLEAE